MGLRKKSKASKTTFDSITLTKGGLHDIGEMVSNVIMEALQQFTEENQMVLGALRTQIQEMHVHTPQAGTLSNNLVVRTVVAEEMLCTHMTNTIVLPERTLVTEN